MAGEPGPPAGPAHALQDHALGREVSHTHDSGASYDHDHDDCDEDADGLAAAVHFYFIVFERRLRVAWHAGSRGF